MVRVLIVDDSPTVRELLTEILHRDPEIEVIATADNGSLAVQMVSTLKPDLVTMDLALPRMNGLEAIRSIMDTCPTPIIVVTGAMDPKDSKGVFNLISAGALAVLPIPEGIGNSAHNESSKNLIAHIKALSEMKVHQRPKRSMTEPTFSLHSAEDPVLKPYQVLAMGASTGGPLIVRNILHDLPTDLPFSVLLAQHMTRGFMEGFVDWLSEEINHPIKIAEHGEIAVPGHVYCAPDYMDMELHRGMQLALKKHRTLYGPIPSISRLFASVADACGSNAIAVLLTGMGNDGSEGMKRLKKKGALTIAQNEESSVIYGMPKEAVKAGAVDHILSPEEISKKICSLLNSKR